MAGKASKAWALPGFWVSIAEVFYYVNDVNVNNSVKNSTVDCKFGVEYWALSG